MAVKKVAKKKVARKAAAPGGARKVAKKAPVKKVAKKSPAKKVAAKKSVKRTAPTRATNIHGFVDGTDSALICEAMLEGGTDRSSVNDLAIEKIRSTNGLETRGGGEKNVPSLMSGILSNLKAKGYEVEATWRLVPPADIADEVKKEMAAKKRAATRKANKASA